MMYEKQVELLQIINRGLNRFAAIERTWQNELLQNVHLAAFLYPIETKKVRDAIKASDRSTLRLAIAYEKAGIASFPLIEQLKEVRKRLAFLTSRKRKITSSLSVTLDDYFQIKPISYGRKSIMVSISHPALKTNVTRHLRRSGDRFTGTAPFGDINIFIEYQVITLLNSSRIEKIEKEAVA